MKIKPTSIVKRNRYWNQRFSKGAIYTKRPSSILSNFQIAQYLKKGRGKSMLVVGGGYGRNAALLAKQGWRVTNTDVSRHAITLGKQIYERTPNLHFQIDDATKTGLPSGRFDAVVCLYVLSLFTLEEVAACLRGIRRVLKPHSIFLCNFLALSDDEYKRSTKTKSNTILLDKGQQLVQFYARGDATALIRAQGFSIKQVHYATEIRFVDILKQNITSRSWVIVATKSSTNNPKA